MRARKGGREEMGRVADDICLILHTVYRSKRRRFIAEADARGVSLEGLAAAAIAGMLAERYPALWPADATG